MKDLLTNKYVYVIVMILVVLNLLGYLMYGQTNILIIFAIIAGLVYSFASTKNMVIILGIPLVLVNLLVLLEKHKEGLENKGHQPVKTAAKAKVVLDPSMNAIKDNAASLSTEPADDSSSAPESYSEEAFASIGAPRKNGKYRVDYASTIEDAYNELNNVLGSDGIKNMTADTQRLLEKQLAITESMKGMHSLIQGMAPLLKQAQGMLGVKPPIAP